MSVNRGASRFDILRKGKIAALALTIAAFGAASIGGAESVHAAEPGTKLEISSKPFVIGGQKVYLPAAIVNGESYIGLRSLNDRLGIGTSWNQKSREAVLTGRGRTMQVISTDGYRLNGERVYASPSYIQAGSTFVPLRFVLESFGYNIGYDGASKSVIVDPISENNLTWKSEQISYQAAKLKLLVSYPVLSGAENEEAISKINAKLKAEAERYAAAGRQTLQKAAKENAEAERDYPDTTIPPVEYEGAYTVTYNEAGKISLYVDYYLYTGGAHGGTERVPYTFDLKTGALISLKEAAGGNSDYVSIINKAIQAQIKQQQLLPLLVPFKTIESDRPYFLKHGALVVYFKQYEYTPYAAGMPEFTVPFSAFL